MRHTEQIYQSILHHLSLVPTDKLSDIEEYLRLLRLQNMTLEEKKANAEASLTFAGMWNEISDDELALRLQEGKHASNEIFNKEVNFEL
jgi:hypothetical protein